MVWLRETIGEVRLCETQQILISGITENWRARKLGEARFQSNNFYHYHRNREQAYGANHDERATVGGTRGCLPYGPDPCQPHATYPPCIRNRLSATVCILSRANECDDSGGPPAFLSYEPSSQSSHQSAQASRCRALPHLGASARTTRQQPDAQDRAGETRFATAAWHGARPD